MTAQTHTAADGPLIPLPDRTPAALRVAVTRLNPAALAQFDQHWEMTTREAHDAYDLAPFRAFTEHWFTWVAVHRHPYLAARLHECEQTVAQAEDRTERRAAAAEISRILRTATEAA